MVNVIIEEAPTNDGGTAFDSTSPVGRSASSAPRLWTHFSLLLSFDLLDAFDAKKFDYIRQHIMKTKTISDVMMQDAS